jgi:DNA-binding response OmpR family regulator
VATAAAALAAGPADMVLVDLGLPDMDGLDVCRELRARGDVPIIVISARADEVDRVVGLEIGADDYVSKPFGVREVIARMRAVLRRVRPAAEQEPESQRLGSLSVDRRARRVFVDGAELSLTPKEHDLLVFLAEAPGAAFTREQIMEAVWDENWFGPTRTLDVHIGALRRKLGDAAAIETVRGVGFRLVLP